MITTAGRKEGRNENEMEVVSVPGTTLSFT
jgi:hypothetical protein